MPYASTSDELEQLVGGDLDLVNEALRTGQGEMFDAFRAGGYDVPPDTTEIADTTERAALDAMLVACNRALAAWHLTQHLSDASDKIKAQADFWRAWLLRIATGSLVLVGLTQDTSAQRPAFAIAGDTRNVFTDQVFNALRYFTGDVN